MNTPTLIKSFVPGAAINPYRIVKHDTADNTVIQAAAAADLSLGVTGYQGAASTDDTVDVILEGVAEVELGGTVTRGQQLTAGAAGVAVTAAAGNRAIGIAMASGVAGDVVGVLLKQSTV